MKTTTLLSILVLSAVLSLPVAAAEWTDFPLAAGARAVYVSSSEGNDANDGLTPATAKRSVTAGFTAVRNGAGDHLYLKRGDTFSDAYPVVWNKSGLSAAYPAVLGAYGDGPRPVIDRGGEYGMHISPQSGPTVRYVAVTGIHFRAGNRDWSRPGFTTAPTGRPAIFMAAGSTAAYPMVENVLIEDCKFEFMGGGVSMVGNQPGSIRSVRINRNVFADIYVARGHTNAVYASNVTGLTIEENLIDGVQRTAQAAGVPNVEDSPLSHSVYVQSDSREVVLQNNIMNNAFDGGMMRPGGTYARNLVLRVTIGNHQGYMFSESAPVITEGVEAGVTGNAFIGTSQYAVQMGNIRQGFAVGNLMLANATNAPIAFNLIGRREQDTPNYPQVGVNHLTIFDNFVLGMQALNASGPFFCDVAVTQNEFRSPLQIVNHRDYEAGDFRYATNQYLSTGSGQPFRVLTTNYDLAGWTAFIGESDAVEASSLDPASAPTLAGYHGWIGGAASEAAFLAAARQQSRRNWDDRYMAVPVIIYLRTQINRLLNPTGPS